MLIDLSNMWLKIVVITSVSDTVISGNISVFGYDKENSEFWKVSCKHIPVEFPGTGDAFTSVLIGSLLKGNSLPIALEQSVQFISISFMESYGYNYPRREDNLLEKTLDTLKMPILGSNYELLN